MWALGSILVSFGSILEALTRALPHRTMNRSIIMWWFFVTKLAYPCARAHLPASAHVTKERRQVDLVRFFAQFACKIQARCAAFDYIIIDRFIVRCGSVQVWDHFGNIWEHSGTISIAVKSISVAFLILFEHLGALWKHSGSDLRAAQYHLFNIKWVNNMIAIILLYPIAVCVRAAHAPAPAPHTHSYRNNYLTVNFLTVECDVTDRAKCITLCFICR